MLSAADTEWTIATAREVGFDLCGIVPVEDLADGGRLNDWLSRGFAGEMRYLFDPRRDDIASVMAEARSVIVCAINYNASQPHSIEAAAGAAAGGEARAWISRYAWGDDYHETIGGKLEELARAMHTRFGDGFAARCYVDTGPVSERGAARMAGLGWLGKNTCLINETLGSSLFLGVIVTSLELGVIGESALTPPPDLCGNCRLCLDACPTGALVEPYVLDARRCISYLTIELRGNIPEELRPGMGWQVFGCDICQDVCPWNRTAPTTSLAAFQPRERLVAPELEWLLSLDVEEFRRVFRGGPVKRAKWRGLIRNACVAAGNAGPRLDALPRARVCERLGSLAAAGDEVISEHARWALKQLGAAGA
jgi:epoxyqueuosine reductase